jgi:HlyD family secretion protein
MRKWPFALLTVLLGTALLATGCSLPRASAQAPAQAPPAEEPAVAVEVATAQTGAISEVLDYPGSLQPQRSVTVVPRVGGQIQSVAVKVGEEVRAGDPIAVIESDIYQLQLEQAQVGLDLARLRVEKAKQGTRPEQLAAAKAAADIAHAALQDAKNPNDSTRTVAAANLAQAEAGLRLAQYQYDKVGYIPQAGMTPQALQLQQATTAYEQAKAAYDMQMNPSASRLAALEGQVVQADLNLKLAQNPVEKVDMDMAELGIKQAEAVVQQAQLQVDYATIRAPFDGVVAELYIHPGSMAGPQVPVASVISAELEVPLNIEESRIAQVAAGQNAALRVNAYPDRSFGALVTSVSPAADAKTHTFVVKVVPADVEDPLQRGDGLLRSGMYANVSILTQEHQQALLVPRAAVTDVGDPLQRVDGQQILYVVTGGRAEPRTVTTGLTDDSRVEIVSGLKAGETVVVAGQSNLTAGAPVKVIGQ